MRTPTTPHQLDVVICTFDNAPLLDRALAALGAQRPTDDGWQVLVVDNNSTDHTREVVARHRDAGAVPGLRVVGEPTQGLTPARLRGVRETTAPWVAFVDDDCLLDPGWLGAALTFARANADCGGFGGRVVPHYDEGAPAVLASYGWAFAEQDLGATPIVVDCLVGAGMVLNRAALLASGWVDEPFLADRTGRRLLSGGDVEIALRVAATGRPLWYVPGCHLDHVIPGHRTTMPYLVRIVRGLGVSSVLAGALTWRGSRRSWAGYVVGDLVRALVPLARATSRAYRGPVARHDAALAASYELGRWLGAARVAALLPGGRCTFFGQGRPDRVGGEAGAVRAR
jgi:glucosyl-dolichyl phosphate glucuronosyltransferase